MKIRLFQIDAFTTTRFHGNPAAVCPLSQWVDPSLMQAIAAENNLAETAFIVASETQLSEHCPTFEIRWFTPETEVDLCGHATLAAGFTLMNHLGIKSNQIDFLSHLSGELACHRSEAGYTLDFPVDTVETAVAPAGLLEAMGAESDVVEIAGVYRGSQDYLLHFENQQAVAELKPDFKLLRAVPIRGVIATAPGDDCDFVSRFFGPAVGIDEDPVTGAAHTTLAPFWAPRLQYAPGTAMVARQISQRGGDLICKLSGDRVQITGNAVTYLIGEIEV